jgi:hypothetical protein
VSCFSTGAPAGANSRLDVLAQTLLAKTNEPLRNADILLASIRLAKLATSRLANSFLGEFVHLSDLVCVVWRRL